MINRLSNEYSMHLQPDKKGGKYLQFLKCCDISISHEISQDNVNIVLSAKTKSKSLIAKTNRV